MTMKEELIEKIKNRTLTMGVCGLGYVGLPLAVDKAKHGLVGSEMCIRDSSTPLALTCSRKRWTWSTPERIISAMWSTPIWRN